MDLTADDLLTVFVDDQSSVLDSFRLLLPSPLVDAVLSSLARNEARTKVLGREPPQLQIEDGNGRVRRSEEVLAPLPVASLPLVPEATAMPGP